MQCEKILLYSFCCVQRGWKNKKCCLRRFRNIRKTLCQLFYTKFNLQNVSSKKKNEVNVIFSDELMTKSILDSIDMNETHIFYDHFHLKANLEKSLLYKWKVVQPLIDLMFRESSQEILEILLKKAINDCSGNTNCVSTLIKLIDKKPFG